MFHRVAGKFLGMRRPDDYVVMKTGEQIYVQGSRSIGQFDPVTGVGVLNWKGSHSKHNVHLSSLLGAQEFTFPAEFVDACLRVVAKPGEHLGGGVYMGGESEATRDVGTGEDVLS